MDTIDLFSRFAVALGIGLLIGLERGWTRRGEKPGSRTAGIRTFSITALLGAVAGASANALGGAGSVGGGLALGLAFLAFAVAVTLFCIEENRAERTFSATTAVAAMLAFALGAYALIGMPAVAGAVAVAATALLASRHQMHGWLQQIKGRELRSALILLAMTFIALPVVPDDPVGPFGGVNPREIWLIAIVLAGVSFLGYLAVRYFGVRHGVLIAAAAGGLVSSTAVTADNARRAAAGEGSPVVLAAGVATASAVSFARVGAIVAALKPVLLPFVLPPLAAATIVAIGYALISVYWRPRKDARGQAAKFRNPFGFWSVVGFAVLLALIVLAGRLLGEWLGAAGAIAGAFALGLADVDAITVSMARLAPQPLSPQFAALAILAAVVSNTLAKIAIGAAVGRGAFALNIAAVHMGCLAVGVAAFLAAAYLYPA
jgi:uncharacterized membrane protein (DUF4010 family)